MKPTHYNLNNGVAQFLYDVKELDAFLLYGRKHGNNGGFLVEIDYNTKMCKYKWFGTIEAPCKELRTISMEHSEFMDGKLSTPDEIINPPKTEEKITHSYRFEIIDFSKQDYDNN